MAASERRPALVLGATGSFGGGVALEMARRGWPVRVLARDVEKARKAMQGAVGIEYVQGDVQDADGLRKAAEGCGVIVHGVNYPYPEWRPHMETATANVIAAARATGAIILFPGNVYGFGAQTGRELAEDAPMRPNTRKGQLRVELEEALRKATEDGRARVLVVRAGDYFGPTVRNGLVDPIFGGAATGKPGKTIGRLDIPHQWAFIPDLARASVELLEKAESLAPFEVVHFAGHVLPSNQEMIDTAAREAGRPGLKVGVWPWWMLRGVGLFDPMIRELMEMRYLFDSTVVISGDRLRRLLPDFAPTPLAEAVRETVESYRVEAGEGK